MGVSWVLGHGMFSGLSYSVRRAPQLVRSMVTVAGDSQTSRSAHAATVAAGAGMAGMMLTAGITQNAFTESTTETLATIAASAVEDAVGADLETRCAMHLQLAGLPEHHCCGGGGEGVPPVQAGDASVAVEHYQLRAEIIATCECWSNPVHTLQHMQAYG